MNMGKLVVVFVLCMNLCTAANANIEGGNEGGNGGDHILARQQTIREKIADPIYLGQSLLKLQLTKYLRWVNRNPESIRKADARKTMQALLANGIQADIEQSTYKVLLDAPCIEMKSGKRLARPATARMGDLGGNICFSATMLAKRDVKTAELLALAIHEHAHHYGTADEDHQFMSAVLGSVDRYILQMKRELAIRAATEPKAPGPTDPHPWIMERTIRLDDQTQSASEIKVRLAFPPSRHYSRHYSHHYCVQLRDDDYKSPLVKGDECLLAGRLMEKDGDKDLVLPLTIGELLGRKIVVWMEGYPVPPPARSGKPSRYVYPTEGEYAVELLQDKNILGRIRGNPFFLSPEPPRWVSFTYTFGPELSELGFDE